MQLELYQYLDVAKKVISKHGTRQMLSDEDAIAYVANFLMTYDQRYKPGMGTIEGYRSMNGRFCIKKWLQKKKKLREVSIEQHSDNLRNQIESSENVMNNVHLNEILGMIDQFGVRERNCIYLYFFESKTLEEISKVYNITKERVRQIIRSALDEIKEKFTDE